MKTPDTTSSNIKYLRDEFGDLWDLGGRKLIFRNPHAARDFLRDVLRQEGSGMGKSQGTGWSTDYYKLPEDSTELMDLIEYRGMSFAVGNIFKAAYRLGHKEGTDAEYDLNKIIWFAQRELARIRKST